MRAHEQLPRSKAVLRPARLREKGIPPRGSPENQCGRPACLPTGYVRRELNFYRWLRQAQPERMGGHSARTGMGYISSREDRGTCAIKNSIWSARMRRLRRMKSSHRLGT